MIRSQLDRKIAVRRYREVVRLKIEWYERFYHVQILMGKTPKLELPKGVNVFRKWKCRGDGPTDWKNLKTRKAELEYKEQLEMI